MAADPPHPEWLARLPPSSWSYGVSRDGRIFFINEEAKSTTWLHPVTGEAVITGHRKTPALVWSNNRCPVFVMRMWDGFRHNLFTAFQIPSQKFPPWPDCCCSGTVDRRPSLFLRVKATDQPCPTPRSLPRVAVEAHNL
ncbi:hypothetical protein NHX12_020604 [Muraenolepis orangiensis]|uniref:WW domain-containing protein n=1 Tax=Muraenolepis orangiensis TaxID=630683 RepID=A0A9Q0IWJ0_9TELE|nr:hypothetical protein NHX12_020604 [Muraenolepis orangiensis]